MGIRRTLYDVRKALGLDPLYRKIRRIPGGPALEFTNSEDYWKKRYSVGLNSGAGSYGRLAEFKAEVLNSYVERHGIKSVIEHGCGDGNQLSLAKYPDYTGLDISPDVIAMCRDSFVDDHSKRFFTVGEAPLDDLRADLSLSLDVVYHLIEDSVYESYMESLFATATRSVIIYASNGRPERDANTPQAEHVHHRKFTDWVDAHDGWDLKETIKNRYPFDPDDPGNTSFADFYIYERNAG